MKKAILFSLITFIFSCSDYEVKQQETVEDILAGTDFAIAKSSLTTLNNKIMQSMTSFSHDEVLSLKYQLDNELNLETKSQIVSSILGYGSPEELKNEIKNTVRMPLLVVIKKLKAIGLDSEGIASVLSQELTSPTQAIRPLKSGRASQVPPGYLDHQHLLCDNNAYYQYSLALTNCFNIPDNLLQNNCITLADYKLAINQFDCIVQALNRLNPPIE